MIQISAKSHILSYQLSAPHFPSAFQSTFVPHLNEHHTGTQDIGTYNCGIHTLISILSYFVFFFLYAAIDCSCFASSSALCNCAKSRFAAVLNRTYPHSILQLFVFLLQTQQELLFCVSTGILTVNVLLRRSGGRRCGREGSIILWTQRSSACMQQHLVGFGDVRGV